MCDAANADANASSRSPKTTLRSGFIFLKILEKPTIPFPNETDIS